MKKSIIIWVTAIILVVVAVYTTSNYNAKSSIEKNPPPPSPTPAGSSQTGDQPAKEKINLMADYDFTLEDLKGNKVTLSQLKGKKVYLNFWATWCPPCKAEMPDIEKLYQETKDSDLVILTINVGEDKKTVADFIAKNKYNFPVLLDVKGEVSQLYQVSGIPTSYFINTDGFLNDTATGGIPFESMKEFVNNLK
jgi:thiol-disulfide isomerase/thioredoxin